MKNFHLATAISVLMFTPSSFSKDNVDAESQVENLTKNGVDTNFSPNSIYSEASGILLSQPNKLILSIIKKNNYYEKSNKFP